MKIVVLSGGFCTERHVGLVSGSGVCRALREKGHPAIFVDMFMGLENYHGRLEDIFDAPDGLLEKVAIEESAPDLEAVRAARQDKSPSLLGKDVLKVCAMADAVFLAMHGANGEDGRIQAALDLVGVPYTGSGYLGSAMAMDKAVTKRMMDSLGIRTAPWVDVHYTKDDIPRLTQELMVPCAVKMVNGGSSIGTYLPAVEIIPKGEYFDYVCKYQKGGAEEICPAPISDEEWHQVGEMALKLHQGLGLAVYSRSDFLLDAEGKAWCLEINTLPGMTPTSLVPQEAAQVGLSYADLCEKIVLDSIEARKAEYR